MLPGCSQNETQKNEEDWELARRGICLILNNRNEEAEALFENKGESVQLAIGHAYVAFMNALMTCEEDSLEKATGILRDVESRCAQSLGWLRAMKNKVFGRNDLSTYESLEQQIALADCQVCTAFLSLMTQDSTAGWVKGGWALRKAWGLYHSTYNYLAGEYKRVFGINVELPGSDTIPWRILSQKGTTNTATTPLSPTGSWSIPTTPSAETPTNGYKRHWTRVFSTLQSPQLCGEEIRRLMSAACFGYGLFHLCISMLPSTLLRLIQILGFSGDRVIGLDALMFARHGPDMRAPLATLALLWYHTIMKPLLAVDVRMITASITAAETLLEESKNDFSQSGLFLFFHGRVCRLKNKIEEGIKAYELAMQKCGQRELGLLCLHEMAWCYLIQLDFGKSYATFTQLREQSHWSKVFYTYLTAVCSGCLGNKASLDLLAGSLLRLSGSLSHLDTMISRRSKLLLPFKPSFYYRLLAYEMIYLWNSLPAQEGLKSILLDCESNQLSEEPMTGLLALIRGVCYMRLGQLDSAKECLNNGITLREECPTKGSDAHISAYSLYELALVYITSKEDINEGIRLLETAQAQYSSYDFESRLSLRIHSALREHKSPQSFSIW